ncbi:MAG TPA: hypothetical protein VGG32_00995 [Thermoplasmata archaeon]|jgi:hypothetical protein
MRDTEIAYLAGLFDGEGCLMIRVGRGRYYDVIGDITSVDEAPIRWLEQVTGVGHVQHNIPRNGNRPWYNWRVSTRQLEPLLRAMLPYLIIKRERAELALQFISGLKRAGPVLLTPETLALRESYRLRMRALNFRKGKPREGSPLPTHSKDK